VEFEIFVIVPGSCDEGTAIETLVNPSEKRATATRGFQSQPREPENPIHARR
jgi:hypothetical protein